MKTWVRAQMSLPTMGFRAAQENEAARDLKQWDAHQIVLHFSFALLGRQYADPWRSSCTDADEPNIDHISSTRQARSPSLMRCAASILLHIYTQDTLQDVWSMHRPVGRKNGQPSQKDLATL